MTEKQRRFAAAYARCGDAAQAAAEAGLRAKDLRKAGLRLLRVEAVAALLAQAEAARQADGSPEQRVLRQLEQIVFAAPDDETGPKMQERLRATELLMKHLGMFERPKASGENVLRVELSERLAAWAE